MRASAAFASPTTHLSGAAARPGARLPDTPVQIVLHDPSVWPLPVALDFVDAARDRVRHGPLEPLDVPAVKTHAGRIQVPGASAQPDDDRRNGGLAKHIGGRRFRY